jgi:hypothetical protein
MKSEFKRFNLRRLGPFIIIFELVGAFGLLIGLFFNPLLLLSSGGLSLLMFLGLITRFKVNDNFLASFPALFFMILNGYIFYLGIAE